MTASIGSHRFAPLRTSNFALARPDQLMMLCSSLTTDMISGSLAYLTWRPGHGLDVLSAAMIFGFCAFEERHRPQVAHHF